MVLDKIIERKKMDLAEVKKLLPLPSLIKRTEQEPFERRPFYNRLAEKGKLHLIFEVKKASPSEGVIRATFQPKALAQDFESAGASAISVLTEEQYFEGRPEFVKEIRSVTRLPLLRKDFI